MIDYAWKIAWSENSKIKNNNKKEKLRFVKGKYFVKSFLLAEQIWLAVHFWWMGYVYSSGLFQGDSCKCLFWGWQRILTWGKACQHKNVKIKDHKCP